MKHNKLIISLGLLLLAAALFVGLGNFYAESRAGREAQKISEQLEVLQAEKAEEIDQTVTEQANEPADMTKLELDGEEYIGVVEIPSIQLKLPVYSEWSDERLKNAPCRYDGSVHDDDLIIVGRDYKKHFDSLDELPLGTQIVFWDAEERLYPYEIKMVQWLDPEDIGIVKQGDWDMTLFACDKDGQPRFALRCVHFQDE